MVISVKQDAQTAPGRQADFVAGAAPALSTGGAGAPRPFPTDLADVGPILASIGDVPYEWDIASDRLSWGKNAAAVLGLDNVETIATGRDYARLLASETAVTPFDAIMNAGRDQGSGMPYQIEYALRAGERGGLWIEDSGRWFGNAEGKPRFAHGVIRVINERHARHERLAYLAAVDALTGEINRWSLTDALAKTLDETIRDRGSCAFLLLAIDNLAHINEAYGYDVADEAIGAVAKRLRAKLRAGDLLGRFSGNRFGIILRKCTADEMAFAAERLLAGVHDALIQTTTAQIALTVTIGGVVAPRHARDLTEMLARAQEALDCAKAKRHGSFVPYRPSIERAALRRENVQATDEIVAALNDRRILIAFEPVVDAASRQPRFYEALMRVRRADGSLISATTIIPIAERLGLVCLLDHRALELVVAELAATPALELSINVSPASTMNANWWNCLTAQLKTHPGIGKRLTIEITEMAAIHDIDEMRGFVSRVKDLGCRIAIDDFGAGYTSFRNLRRLGVDMVKIDGAFVQNIARSEDDRIFVRALIDLAHALGLQTVAEWVQSEQAAAQLAAWGCDHLQGALIGPALVEQPWNSLAHPGALQKACGGNG